MTRAVRWYLALATASLTLLVACDPPPAPPPADATLQSLTLSTGALDQTFDPAVSAYTAAATFLTTSIRVIATATDAAASVEVNGAPVASGAASEAIPLDEGVNMINVEVTAKDNTTSKVYQVILTRDSASQFAQQAYVKASNPQQDDWFGYSLALDGDTLAVGALQEDSNGTGVNTGNQADNSAADSGAVYVFVRSGDTWTQQAYIKASNAGAGDRFGYSVALSGDTLAVGAIFEDSDATGVNGDQLDDDGVNSGAVYVFVRDGATWTQQAYIKASNTDSGDWFGSSVALSGDTLAVGATQEDSGATGVDQNQTIETAPDSGAVYVFVREGDVWTQQAYVKASNTDSFDAFGTSVALDGDTLAVSAHREASNAKGINPGGEADNSATNSGAVYVFSRSGGSWSQQAFVKASNSEAEDQFGVSVALSGNTLVVGAPYEDSGATGVNGNQTFDNRSNSGAVYVFVRNATTWTQEAYLKASNPDVTDLFGYSVAAAGDLVVVGAPYEASNADGVGGNQDDNSLTLSGAAYVFARTDAAWTQVGYVKASNSESSDLFTYVAVSGDTVAIGAYGEASNAGGIDGNQDDNSIIFSGAVYVFR